MQNRDHWLLPSDATEDEKNIYIYAATQNIYNKFTDPLDKLIIALHFELNYPQKDVGAIIGRTDVTISIRVKKIRTVLEGFYKSRLKQ